jgi:hypothetical protein
MPNFAILVAFFTLHGNFVISMLLFIINFGGDREGEIFKHQE